MRRVLVLLLLAIVPLAGCGSSSSSGSANPVSSELSYFPSGSAFVMSIVTDPNSTAIKQAQALIAKFPIASFGESALTAKLQQVGIDYQSDVRPLLGNPIMFGLTSSIPTGSASSKFLVVWTTKDAGKLSALIKKVPGARSIGSHDGAKLYQTGSATTVAVDGATAVLAATESDVNSALDRHQNGGGITLDEYTHALAGLPQDALLQAFGNLQAVLSQPSAAKARKVPWVAALRGYGTTMSATATGLTFQYRLDTTGASLTSAQVPFASGTATPNLAGGQPITVGIENPAHIASFLESVAQTTSPAGYAKFQRHQAAVRKKTGVDLNSLLSLLTGELIVSSDTHRTMGRAAVSDPAAAASVLAKLARAPSSAFNGTTRIAHLGGGFYAIKSPKRTITIGMAGNQLVVGKATVAQLRAFAAAPATVAPGAQGSVAFRVALSELLQLAMGHSQQSKIVQTILNSLGDVTGWIAASPGAITGSATLTVH